MKVTLIIFLLFYPFCFINAEVKTNSKAPNIIMRDIKNNLVFGNAILKEKPILLSFFFTDCLPCKKEIPELENLNKKHSNKIKMFLVSIDKQGTDVVLPYIKKMNITIDVLIDKYSDSAREFGVTKYPSVFIIGKNGIILYSCSGYQQDNIRNIEFIIQGL